MTFYKNGQLKKGIGQKKKKKVHQRKKMDNVKVKYVHRVIEEIADHGMSTPLLFQKLLDMQLEEPSESHLMILMS